MQKSSSIICCDGNIDSYERVRCGLLKWLVMRGTLAVSAQVGYLCLSQYAPSLASFIYFCKTSGCCHGEETFVSVCG